MSAAAIRETMRGSAEPLEQTRLLTEVDHLLTDGSKSTLQAVKINLYTALQEMAMPYAVTMTFQPVHYETDAIGQCRRMFLWLGRHAVAVATSGKKFHTSPAALDRVDVEVAEAAYSQETLTAGRAQAFISPKMSAHDAPRAVAAHEYLADDDSVRVSRLVTDMAGNTLGRRIESLLVRDIPLESWVAMLKDPNNIFGKPFSLRNEASALSVMEVFEGLELPEDKLPEGPVSLVAAVTPYITSTSARRSVEKQLVRFRRDQAQYRAKAEQMADEWLSFEQSLADSLATGQATGGVRSFIYSLQHQWGEQELGVLARHERDDGYAMTRELAALLEKAKRHLLAATAAVITNNEKVVNQLSPEAAERIRRQDMRIHILQTVGAPADVILTAQADLYREIAGQRLRVGGGCAGEASSTFGGESTDAPDENRSATGENKSDWKWSTGTCRVKNCPSPNPTEVGPCSVCRRCQRLFDSGRDPTSGKPERPASQSAVKKSAASGLSRLLLAAA